MFLIRIILFLFPCAFLLSSYKLTLKEAEDIALSNNYHVLATKELLEKAEQGRLEAISKWFPKLMANSWAYEVENLHPVYPRHTGQYATLLSLTQSVFSMPLYYNVKIADVQKEQIALLHEAARNDVLYKVRSLYYQVILDEENVRTQRENVKLLIELSRQMEDRYRVGEAILYNVNQSKVAISNMTANYYDAVKQKKHDLDLLAEALGYDIGIQKVELAEEAIPVESFPVISAKMQEMENLFAPGEENVFRFGFVMMQEERMAHLFSPSEVRNWQNLAKQYRPDVLLQERAIALADQQINLELAEYYPTLEAHFNYGGIPSIFAFYPSSKFTNQNFDWGVGLRFRWMLFDSLGRERRVAGARAEKRAQIFDLKKRLQTAFVDVRDQIYMIEESVSNLVTAKASVKLAEETVRLANQQLDVGYVTVFDYLTTVDSLARARNNFYKARYDLVRAYFGLRHATGLDVEGEEHG